ncbi:HNH endonuclease [Cereibacter sphaeroides]|uniref:HNH endonuclease n=1 Tax=Cereibacter sphaeroides TaxID=1063 RepID=A0AAX1UN01_CERSP|nr:HNH endonuclease signature motif containing protein [Cereibacter sphaeroides]RHZ96465.1 HNH endonuclease [Cereibacter sphaeroides]
MAEPVSERVHAPRQCKKPLPSRDYLLRRLTYDPDSGKLRWMAVSQDDMPKAFRAWNKRYAGTAALSWKNQDGYLCGNIDSVLYQAHRIIWKMQFGVEAEEIDHINGVRDDNRLENLREVTRSINMHNIYVRGDNKSGTTGVCWAEDRKAWRAYIDVDGKRRFIGRFDSIAAAVAARKAAEERLGYIRRA